MIKNIFKLLIISTLSLSLFQCTTYNVKKDTNKNGELTKTPKWYVKYNRDDKKWIYETATSVSPDLELSVKKSIVLAKAKLADRYNGKINNKLRINKKERGVSEALSTNQYATDEIINSIKNTLVKDYIVEKVEIFFTHNKSYRSYVKLKVSKDNIEAVLSEIKQKEQIKSLSKNDTKGLDKIKEDIKKILN
tara:strand:+ start:723 stop:1298 length:576 start_codon:yes stop_codon:yes gene_type:complete